MSYFLSLHRLSWLEKSMTMSKSRQPNTGSRSSEPGRRVTVALVGRVDGFLGDRHALLH